MSDDSQKINLFKGDPTKWVAWKARVKGLLQEKELDQVIKGLKGLTKTTTTAAASTAKTTTDNSSSSTDNQTTTATPAYTEKESRKARGLIVKYMHDDLMEWADEGDDEDGHLLWQRLLTRFEGETQPRKQEILNNAQAEEMGSNTTAEHERVAASIAAKISSLKKMNFTIEDLARLFYENSLTSECLNFAVIADGAGKDFEETVQFVRDQLAKSDAATAKQARATARANNSTTTTPQKPREKIKCEYCKKWGYHTADKC